MSDQPSAEVSQTAIGQTLRAARLQHNLSLRELAEKAEVSASLLSKVENGKANPSVRTLHSIADALSLPVHHFFSESKKTGTALSDASALKAKPKVKTEMTPSELRAARTADLIDDADLGLISDEKQAVAEPVVHPETRQSVELLGGIVWERLTPGPEENIEFLQIYYEVGAKSGEKMSHHSGREFQYVLEGTLQLELGFENHILEAGDSIIFDSLTPHRLSNIGDRPMRALSVIFNTK